MTENTIKSNYINIEAKNKNKSLIDKLRLLDSYFFKNKQNI